ncbi:hypothetical protein ACHAXT_004663 [Thalassiosira profunda]
MPPIPDATNVDASDKSADSRVSFNTEVDVEEAAPVESYTRKTSQELRAAKTRQSLSASAKAWDIDGDGTLDDTELALKALDKSAKGTLNKDQMYHLMEQNFGRAEGAGQGEEGGHRDTTSSEGKLVDSKTGQALATDSTTTVFEASPQLTRRHRALCETTTGNGNKLESAVCTGSPQALDLADGNTLVEACKDGASVTLVLDGTHHHPCPVVGPATDSYSGNGGSSHRGITINYADGSSQSVQPVNDAGEVKTDGSATKYVATGFSSPVLTNGDACDPANDMCGENLQCYDTGAIDNYVCACANDVPCAEGEACSVPCNTGSTLPSCRAIADLHADCASLSPDTPLCDYAPANAWCIALKGIGETCADSTECDANLQCYDNNGELTCKCANDDACDGDDVCSVPCNMDDVPPGCWAQADLNVESMCEDFDPATPHCEAGFSYRQCTATPR